MYSGVDKISQDADYHMLISYQHMIISADIISAKSFEKLVT